MLPTLAFFREVLEWNFLIILFYQGQTPLSKMYLEKYFDLKYYIRVGNTVTKVGSAISANNSYRKIPSVSALKNPKWPRTSNFRKESDRSEKECFRKDFLSVFQTWVKSLETFDYFQNLPHYRNDSKSW